MGKSTQLQVFVIVTIFAVVFTLSFSMYNKLSSTILYTNNYFCKINSKWQQTSDEGVEIDVTKPLFVIGILTRGEAPELRHLQRRTWISTMNDIRKSLPFNIEYKFLVDKSSKTVEEENRLFNDIYVLNAKHSKRAVKFGEKLYIWFKYVYEAYPTADLVAKMDDDVFLCIPEMFRHLSKIRSPLLYFGGYFHGSKEEVVNYNNRHDEMFVVLGRELVKRIAQRRYCETTESCDKKTDLIDTNYGGTSLGVWLYLYKDIDLHKANNITIHIVTKYPGVVTPDFCNKYLLLHKASQEMVVLSNYDTLRLRNKPRNQTVNQTAAGYSKIVKQAQYVSKHVIHSNNTNSSALNNDVNLSVSGRLFSGNKIRSKLELNVDVNRPFVGNVSSNSTCRKWAVLTTIFGVSEAVKTIVESKRWCLVVIADNKSIAKAQFMQQLKQKTTVTSSAIYLTPDEQDQLYPVLSKGIPRNNYGRKNIGYIYAIQHGAEVIWDFDDDNIGILNENITPQRYVTPCDNVHHPLLNPYPYYGTNESYVWPRGFPLQQIKNASTHPAMCERNDSIKVGIIQSLANHEPDVDAIFRLTRDAPFNFSKPMNTVKPMIVPQNSYVPLNAQASMWFPATFMYLVLPLGVNGRVADIWRSYIAEYVMYSTSDYKVMFTPPYVLQIRTAHNFIRDFNAELDLYQKSQQLVHFLTGTTQVRNKVNITKVYMELYMRDYLQRMDVDLIQLWVETLKGVCNTVNSTFCKTRIK